ncbi:type I glyceraldehyde-3-phosphate dehydrogenase [Leucobacter weissii]|uniref:Type I glyceraldehyde-3-phosphate dehydrogenase n=1 Tax=Leucobacter weissii TaxID=1983706 RepID=A0A939MQ81_9MICO|nr:type I glyceraldehyde-3-phosphate dehydrogenase [Leucobacter weissii]MBO1901039.1 type I glyceraldehyde-3-phosphate dehydrogenase [Leucobacter weissii]
MTTRIAINGFGRIGRGALRAILEQDAPVEVVAVNDLADGSGLAKLFNFDSVYGRAVERAQVESGEDGEVLVIGERRIRLLSESDPSRLPWGELGVDTVLEVTGRFAAAEQARAHLDAGAGRVLVGAPSSGADATLVRGVNWPVYDPAAHRIVSNGSCTTNALAPLAKVLHEVAGIEQAFMTTVHAYTQDQNLVDGPHRDPRRARSAALNIVPTSTGAAKAIGLVLPELEGKLSGDALRVPVPVGSIVEINATVAREVSVDELLSAYRAAADGELAGVLRYSDDPLVSSDIVGDPASSIFDSGLVRVAGRHVKVSAWYDNEWGFSNRVAETLVFLAE